MRDQEVLRANKELNAYFKGRRTEREARAALKIIKAFVRDRERRDAETRPPLPGAEIVKTQTAVADRKAAGARGDQPRPKPRPRRRKNSKSAAAPFESQMGVKSPIAAESNESS
jgi:hypothetical protein